MKTIGFFGGGRITRILLHGFNNAAVSFERIAVYDTNEATLAALKAEFPTIEVSSTETSAVTSADLIFIALHPPVLMETMQRVGGNIGKNSLVVSLAPKITVEKLRSALPQVKNLARMNPNAGTYVNKGYNPVSFAEGVDKLVLAECVALFERLGKVPVVDESKIEAYAVISAMGHTYFWFQVQQLKEQAMSYGLTEKEAQETLSAMLWGTTETLFHSGLKVEEVCDLVPVKPMAEHEQTIKDWFKTNLDAIYQKIKP